MQEQKRTMGGAPTQQATDALFALRDEAQQSAPIIPDLVLYRADGTKITSLDEFKLVNAGKFPIRPLPKDKYDTMWKIKEDLVDSGYVDSSRPLPIVEDDIKYLKSKAAAEEYAAFLTWEASKYDLTDPATKEWFHRVCPSYFEQREQLIDDLIDTSAKYAKIRLRGPRTEDELKLEYLIEKGDITLPAGPIWAPEQFMLQSAGVVATDTLDQAVNKVERYSNKVYSAGLFSPLVPTSSLVGQSVDNHKMVQGANPYNQSDITGDPNKLFTGMPGVYPPEQSNYKIYAAPNLGLNARHAEFMTGGDYTKETLQGWANMSLYKGNKPNKPVPNVGDVKVEQKKGMLGSALAYVGFK